MWKNEDLIAISQNGFDLFLFFGEIEKERKGGRRDEARFLILSAYFH